MVALSREDAFASAVNLFSHIDFLKDQKKECIDALLEKKDVLGVLPRGIEKSLIYLLFPKIHLLVNSGEMCHVVVVSALKAIAITEEQVVELNECEFQLQRIGEMSEDPWQNTRREIWGSVWQTEMWQRKNWISKLKTAELKNNVELLVWVSSTGTFVDLFNSSSK